MVLLIIIPNLCLRIMLLRMLCAQIRVLLYLRLLQSGTFCGLSLALVTWTLESWPVLQDARGYVVHNSVSRAVT